jgi:ZIP family zinc transporter
VTSDILAAMILTTLAGLSTGLGSLISYFIPNKDTRYLSISLGFAAGVMIIVAFIDLFYQSRDVIGLNYANLFFFIGMIFMFLIDRLIPHIHIDGLIDSQSKGLCRSSVMTTIGIAIHNLPEGMTVALVSLADVKLGIPIAIAIALHNIPEGVACSVPLYFASGNRKRSCLYSFLAGMTEPLGAIIAILILYPFLNAHVLAASIAFVSGIMIFICLDELLPAANNYGNEHLTSIGIIAGVFMMMLASTRL